MSATIYALIDPDTLEVRYIGQTCQRLNIRLNKHINDAKRRPRSDYPVYVWIRMLAITNKRPIIQAISVNVDPGHLDRLEAMWIGLFRAWGSDLTNTSSGGNGLAHRWEKVSMT